MGVIVYNGSSSRDFGLEVWQAPDYQIPERDYEAVHVPGRDGDLIIDKESFKNTSRSYVVSVARDARKNFTFTQLANRLSEWLHSSSGYSRLEDSYEPDYYRLATYQKALGIQNIYNRAGYATIEFNCKPQRFLKSGDRPIAFGASTQPYLVNPTAFKSRPIIKVFGNGDGELSIGEYKIFVRSIEGFLIIDCERMEAYKDAETNCNSKITLEKKEFPRLIPGNNKIAFSEGITSLEVTPKWWTI